MNIKTFAANMDKYGMLAFIYVVVYAAFVVKESQTFWNWLLLIVGLIGLSVDSYITFNTK